jgi:lyso-ornithine lipid O-acyltransferase
MNSRQALSDAISMPNFRAFVKMLVFVLALTSYFIVTLPFYPVLAFGSERTRLVVTKILQAYSRFTLWFMGIKVDLLDEQKISSHFKNGLIVCNHLSYLDVLILCAHYPSCFVTSVEIKNTPVLGQISQLAGCLFVERRNRDGLKREVLELTQSLKNGLNVAIFPEATSTNGSSLLRFRRPLYEAAIDSKRPILSLCLNYLKLDDQTLCVANRDRVFWYDDMTFVDHLWNFLAIEQTTVQLCVVGLIENPAEYDATELAAMTQQQIGQVFKPILS